MKVTTYTPKSKPGEPKSVYELYEYYNVEKLIEADTKEMCELPEGTIAWAHGLGIFLVTNKKLRLLNL